MKIRSIALTAVALLSTSAAFADAPEQKVPEAATGRPANRRCSRTSRMACASYSERPRPRSRYLRSS